MDHGRVKTGRKSEWIRKSAGSVLAVLVSLGAIKMLRDMEGIRPAGAAETRPERGVEKSEPPERIIEKVVEVAQVVEVEKTPVIEKAPEIAEVKKPEIGNSPVELFNNCSKSVVKVLAFGKEGVRGQGSGFFVNKEGWVVTNEHVIRNKERMQVELSDGKTVAVKKVIAADKKADIAILDTGLEHAYLPLDAQQRPIGTKVYAIGSPRELSNTLSEGLLSGYRDLADGARRMQTTAPISPGSSGGPLLDERGNVVGVTCGFRDDGQNLNFAVTARQVMELMEIGRPNDQNVGSERWWLAQAMRELATGESHSGEQAMYMEIASAASRVGAADIAAQAKQKAQELPSGAAADDKEESKLKECSNYLAKGDVAGACKMASDISQMKIRGQALGLICGYLSTRMSAGELMDWIDGQEGPGELRARACLGAM